MKLKSINLLHKKPLLAVAILVIVCSLVTGGWLLWHRGGESELTVESSTDEALTQALEHRDRGDIDGLLGHYDERIEQAVDDNEKRDLLLYRSIFALRAERIDDALESARQADAIGSTLATTDALAMAYDIAGDKQQAIIHYKKLIESISDDSGMGSRYRAGWEHRLRELEP